MSRPTDPKQDKPESRAEPAQDTDAPADAAREAAPTLGAPSPPRITAEDLANAFRLEDIDEATAARLIAAAMRHIERPSPESLRLTPPDSPDAPSVRKSAAPTAAGGRVLEWEVVQSIPRPGNTQMKKPSAMAGVRVAGEAPPVFRAKVPGGWIYLVDGVPVFVPHPPTI